MTPEGFSEDELVERPAFELLGQLGYTLREGSGELFGADALSASLGRDDRSQVVLVHRLRRQLDQLNPDLPPAAIEEAVEAITRNRGTLEAVRANQDLWELLRSGYDAAIVTAAGDRITRTVRLVDWNDSTANDFLAVRQFRVENSMYARRTDIVCFVNGIPLVLLELKASHRSIEHAYDDNLRDYRDAIPELFTPNAFVVLSNGSETVVGSTFAPWERFAEWKRVDDENEAGIVSLETAVRGLCAPAKLLDAVENFVAYLNRPGGLVKVLAQNHQLLGVNAAIRALRDRTTRDDRLGVFWHTQGSGKSLSMLFFTQKVLRRIPGNWTFVMVTDRTELDDQLYEEFKDAGVVDGHLQATSSVHLRDLLQQDHRYVFSLIQKFRPPTGGDAMPVASDRDDIIVISDEAHRSQYDTYAGNMRAALPNAGFLGFTGTPLIAGDEQKTRSVFGDYISVYDFRRSIEDRATVPLYYENRIPELQITNAQFDDELAAILEEAELDETQEQALARKFANEYQLITRPRRLKRIARDLVEHFVGRGFLGKAMFVAVDKATAVRMYDLVDEAWKEHLAMLEAQAARLPPLERAGLEAQITFMRQTERAVVVSQSQNEIAELAERGVDIRPHRERMLNEDLGERFKDPSDKFRLVFVCAMWMTGFDVPSCSTVYLDRPMRGHTLMQTIARANRVFPEKENGLIVDYVGVFRHLEAALAVYAAGPSGTEPGDIIQDKSELVDELAEAVTEVAEFCESYDVDLHELRRSEGFEYIALRDRAVESLLIDEAVRRGFQIRAGHARRLFAAILPDPSANEWSRLVAVVRNLDERIKSLDPRPDVSATAGAVTALLDESVGVEEYVIRAAADRDTETSLVDLASIDFERLAAQVAGREATAAKRLIGELRPEIESAVRRNPSRAPLAQRLHELIEAYNAGSVNVDELLRRLQQLTRDLVDEQDRTVREGLSDAELAIFDILTRPDPSLTDAERDQVRAVAREMMSKVTSLLVADWRKKSQTLNQAQSAIRKILDEGLPEAYDPPIFDRKAKAVYDHLYRSYFDNGESVYDDGAVLAPPKPAVAEPEEKSAGERRQQGLDEAKRYSEAELRQRVRDDPDFARRIIGALPGGEAALARSTVELLGGDETSFVEFKSTARWNLRDECKDKRMEDVVVKTIAGFLNAAGGALLIGVDDAGRPIGLDHDCAVVTPPTPDGLVNWLTTHLQNALGPVVAQRIEILVERVVGYDVCRVNVPRSSRPAKAAMSDKTEKFFVRYSNSTRALSEADADEYVRERWPSGPTLDG